jgi:type II secretory pathway component GspD/PulD (secretin)
MTRFWIGAAAALWLGALAIAEEPSEVRRPISPQKALSEPRVTDAEGLAARAEKVSPVERRAAPAPPAPAEPVPVVPEGDGQRRHTRIVLRLKAVPANNIAETINRFLRAEGQAAPSGSAPSVVIVPDVLSNSLVIGGPAAAVEKVQELVAKLDHVAALVRLEVVIGDVPVGQADARPEEVRKRMDVLVQAQLTTLDNQPAFLQVGRREGRITGAVSSPVGRTNTVTTENVGTILAVTPRVGADGAVTMQLDIEDSRLGPLDEGVVLAVPSQGEAIRTPSSDKLTTQTTLRIPDGQTVVVGAAARQPKSGKQRLILVTPHVLPVGPEATRGK